MKKITYESWVASFVERLSDYFNLAGWAFEIIHASDPRTDKFVYAKIEVDSVYMLAEITIYPIAKEDFENKRTDRFTKSLVHEFVHIFLDPFHDHATRFLSPATTSSFIDTLEQQTQKLTMVFLKTLPKDIIPPR